MVTPFLVYCIYQNYPVMLLGIIMYDYYVLYRCENVYYVLFRPLSNCD